MERDYSAVRRIFAHDATFICISTDKRHERVIGVCAFLFTAAIVGHQLGGIVAAITRDSFAVAVDFSDDFVFGHDSSLRRIFTHDAGFLPFSQIPGASFVQVCQPFLPAHR